MRYLLVAALVGLCALAASSSDHAQQQADVWRLFKYINQPSYYKDHQEIAKTYNFYENKGLYTKPEVVEHFYEYVHYEVLLPKGEIFSVFNEEHLKQSIALFKLFYYAKDWETMYKTAVWARNHVSEGLFLYSFSVALIHRVDTHHLVLPPIYEIYPHYFYSDEVIQKAQNYKQLFNGPNGEHYNHQIIHANYTGHYLNLHPEQSMSYYTEDVGINAFYYYYNLYYPFWMNGDEYNLKYDQRGELFYYIYQQILARFYLERLSNGWGEIEWFDWETEFHTGYYPSLRYPNGLEFPTRPHHANLHEYFYNYGQNWNFKSLYGYSYTLVKDYERRIRDVIDTGFVWNHAGEKVDLISQEGFNILGNLIESNPDSPYYQYYGAYQTFARHLLGYSYQPLSQHQVYPSALEHFETSLRDPAFYQLYKKLLVFFIKHKHQHHHPYTYQQLSHDGITIKGVEFDRLVTYFETFLADLTNAVYVTPEEFQHDTFRVQVAQERLNHKPFTYKVNVDSTQDIDAVVKVFLGPKYDEYGRYINLTHNWMNFVQFDHFPYHLKSGQNVITRNSHDIHNYIHDRTTFFELYQKVLGVYNKKQYFQLHESQIMYGFPQRYQLPVGSTDGVTYQFYVYITKALPYKTHSPAHVVGSGVQYVDAYPLGYPLDRPVHFGKIYHEIPNGYFQEATIHHIHHGDINRTH